MGFTITPIVGSTIINAISITSANDEPSRDPKSIVVEGSNDDITGWQGGEWNMIYKNTQLENFNERFQRKVVSFENDKAYKNYRLIIQDTKNPEICCAQVAEVELFGVLNFENTQNSRSIQKGAFRLINYIEYRTNPFGFSYHTQPNKIYTVEYSNDLKQWLPLESIKGTGNSIKFVEQRETSLRQQFYRVKEE